MRRRRTSGARSGRSSGSGGFSGSGRSSESGRSSGASFGFSRFSWSGRSLAIAGLIAFLAVDALLVALAIGSTRAESSGEQLPTAPIFSSEESQPTEPTETAAETAEAPTVVAPAPAGWLLSATDATIAWRASVGSCDGDPTVIESTTDGGATWQPRGTARFDARQVLALSAQSSVFASLTAKTGDDCELNALRTFTSGNFWEIEPDESAAYTYLDPADRTVIYVNDSEEPAPCGAAVAVAEAAASVSVHCDDGTLHHRMLDDDEWTSAPAPGLVALTGAGDDVVLAVTGVEGCDGLMIRSVQADDETEDVGCLPTAVQPGSVAMSSAGDSLWITVGTATYVSADRGETWS